MERSAFLVQLRACLGDAALIVRPEDMAPHLVDWRGRYRGNAIAVVRPSDTAGVARVVELCARNAVPIVPQGGNTGLVGGGTPLVEGCEIVLGLSRMNRIRDIDAANSTLTAEAGCLLQQVQAAAEVVDRMFPLSLAAQGSCEIGGNLSTNAGGVHVLRYGNMRDQVLGLEVVLPDGRIWHGLRGLRKDNTGYDLKQLFIGAEGTLGIITAAVLKLQPRPKVSHVCWLALDSASHAIELLSRLRSRFGDRISAFEIVADSALSLVLKHMPGARDPLSTAAPWYALVEFSDCFEGYDLAGVIEREFSGLLEAGFLTDATMAQNLAQAQAIWGLRENISEAQKIEGISIKHDISVPVSSMARFLELADSALRATFPDVRIVAFGHAGDGNLHYNLSKPDAASNAEFIAQTPAVNRIVHDIVDRLGGSISAEHGIGQLKRDELLRYKSPLEIELMRRIRGALDPENLLNRGKLV